MIRQDCSICCAANSEFRSVCTVSEDGYLMMGKGLPDAPGADAFAKECRRRADRARDPLLRSDHHRRGALSRNYRMAPIVARADLILLVAELGRTPQAAAATEVEVAALMGLPVGAVALIDKTFVACEPALTRRRPLSIAVTRLGLRAAVLASVRGVGRHALVRRLQLRRTDRQRDHQDPSVQLSRRRAGVAARVSCLAIRSLISPMSLGRRFPRRSAQMLIAGALLDS